MEVARKAIAAKLRNIRSKSKTIKEERCHHIRKLNPFFELNDPYSYELWRLTNTLEWNEKALYKKGGNIDRLTGKRLSIRRDDIFNKLGDFKYLELGNSKRTLKSIILLNFEKENPLNNDTETIAEKFYEMIKSIFIQRK